MDNKHNQQNQPRAYSESKSIGTISIDKQHVGKSSGQQMLLPQQILPPQIGSRPRKEKTTTILCNSRERNIVTYPNSNEFRWRLRRDLKDILSVRLIGGNIPANLYNINTGWNKFTFKENATEYTITLTPGTYDGSTIAIQLMTAINGTSGIGNVYNVTYSTTTQKLTIKRSSGTYSFSLLFQTGQYTDNFDDYNGPVDSLTNDYLSKINSPARLLGFVTQDYSDTSGTITSPNAIDIGWFMNKLFLHINTESNKEFNRVEVSRATHDPYTVIYLDEIKDGNKFLNKETDYPVIEFAPAPLSRLSLLQISLRDEFYRLIDTLNKEFTLIFEIIYLE